MRRIENVNAKVSDLLTPGNYVIVKYCNRLNETRYGIVIMANYRNSPWHNEMYILSYDNELEGASFVAGQSYNSRYILDTRAGNNLCITDGLYACRDYVKNPTIVTEYTPSSSVTILTEISTLFEECSESEVESVTESATESENSEVLESYFSDNYSRDYVYRGIHRYHYHQGSGYNRPKRGTSPYLIGVELEVEFSDDDARDEFCDAPSNWLYRESDGSLSSMGVEIITIPMLPKDIKSENHWKTLTDSIRSFARSWDTTTCGLHVHIGREILGHNEESQSETIGKLLYFYHQYLKDSSINRRIYGRDRSYNDHDGKCPESDAVKVLGADVLKQKSVRDKVKEGAIARSRTTRYFDINIQNAHTIEFRKGRGSLNPERIVAVIEWSELIVQYAKSTPWVNISLEDFLNYLRIIKPKSSKINDILEDFC